jgi:hypothetical protein
VEVSLCDACEGKSRGKSALPAGEVKSLKFSVEETLNSCESRVSEAAERQILRHFNARFAGEEILGFGLENFLLFHQLPACHFIYGCRTNLAARGNPIASGKLPPNRFIVNEILHAARHCVSGFSGKAKGATKEGKTWETRKGSDDEAFRRFVAKRSTAGKLASFRHLEQTKKFSAGGCHKKKLFSSSRVCRRS